MQSIRYGAIAASLLLSAVNTEAHAGEFRVALSVSPYSEEVLDSGISFTDGSRSARTPEELQQLFMVHGANELFVRIETRRRPVADISKGEEDGQFHTLDKGLTRARMAKSLGLPLNPELGLYANYGDLRFQPAPDFSQYPEINISPGQWSKLTLEQMRVALRKYGEIVAREILATGATVRIWDLGTEVEYGVAGVAVHPGSEDAKRIGYLAPNAVDPAIGKMSIGVLMKMSDADQAAWLRKHVWPANAAMYAAVVEGIRMVDPRARFSTHVSGVTTRPTLYVAFFKAMKEGGYEPDELGFSYYPTIQDEGDRTDRWASFKETVSQAYRELGRPIFIAEFAYAGSDAAMGLWKNAPIAGYPMTHDGQAAFLNDLVSWALEKRMITGVRPWAPELVVEWDSMALFSPPNDAKVAVARPALRSIAKALAVRGQ